MRKPITRDCAGLASGTLATLTGRRTYVAIDAIQAELVAFADATEPGRRWESWIDAWNEFRNLYPSYDALHT